MDNWLQTPEPPPDTEPEASVQVPTDTAGHIGAILGVAAASLLFGHIVLWAVLWMQVHIFDLWGQLYG